MKKLIILVMGMVSAMTLFAGCSKEEEVFTTKNYTVVREEVFGIVIDVHDREIEVTLSEDDQIHIDYYESEKTLYDISVSDDKVLTMTAGDDKEWKDYIGSNADADVRTISIQIPDELLETLTLTTTNEDIVLSALTITEEVSINVNGGNITFDKVNVGNSLNLTVKNGNINGTVAGGWDDYAITCEIKKGDSNLPETKEGGEKNLQVFANNGDVNIEFAK